MTTKRDQVKQYIHNQGEGWQYTIREMHEMVLTLEVSPSTIRVAMNELKAIGAISEDFVYTGRFVRPLELLETLFADDPDNWNYVLLTDSKRDELCANLFTTPLMLIQALDWASCYMTVTSTYYGMSYRLNDKGRAFIDSERKAQWQPVRVAACEVTDNQPTYEAPVEPDDLCTAMIDLGAQEPPQFTPAPDDYPEHCDSCNGTGSMPFGGDWVNCPYCDGKGYFDKRDTALPVVDDDVNLVSAPISDEPKHEEVAAALELVAMLKDAPIASQPAEYVTVDKTKYQKLEAEHAGYEVIARRLLQIADMLPGMAKVQAMNDLIADTREYMQFLTE